ncbi:MAG: fused MFS/spermidine synthase, partial [Planctomycetaceae bacterium]
ICSLMFETLWQRMMYLVFGASAPATTAILTAFFCGIALGSWFGGELLKRSSNPILFYAGVECWIGLWGLAVPFLLQLADAAYVSLYHDAEPGALPRFLLSIAVVLPATLGMGATVPLMNRILSDFGNGVGKSVGLAYGINTIGAVGGTLLTGFVLIRLCGVQNTLYIASGLNALVVLGSFALRNRCAPQPASEADSLAPLESKQLVLLVVYGAAGFLALGFEVTWFRLLSIFCMSSVTTFTLILAIYLFGFSCGSLLLFPWLNKRMRASSLFVLSLWGSGTAALGTLYFVYQIPDVTLFLLVDPIQRGTLTRSHLIMTEVFSGAIMMFIPTLFMGLAYPAICQTLIASGVEVGRQSGRFYFWGTLGSMAGAFCVGLFVIPGLGLVTTFGLLCLTSVCAALWAAAIITEMARPFRWLLNGGGGVVAVCAAAYMVSGHPFVKSGHLQRQPDGQTWAYIAAADGLIDARILRSYKVGRSATVSVEEEHYHAVPGAPARIERAILVDGQDVASSHPDALVDSKMLAHLPLLLHPAPKHALTVGFGSGGTSWSMTCHDIETYCVEIEPMVSDSSDLFADQNYGVTQHPGFHLILNDARDHLHLTGRRYDVISTDVTNLEYKQNGNLYTREYFQLMKDRLAPGGIACAWIPMGSISEDDFKTLIRSFFVVYPHTTLWYMAQANTGFGILIGTPDELKIDMRRLEEGFTNLKVRKDLQEIDIESPFQIVHALHLDSDGIRNYVEQAPLHTDDRPILEFSSPLSHYNNTRLFLINLQSSLNYRSKDLRRYVTHLDAGQQRQFDRYGQAALLLIKMVAAQQRYIINYQIAASRSVIKEQPDVRLRAIEAMRDSLTAGASSAREALELLPDDPDIRSRFEEFDKLLRSMPPADR